MKNTNTPIKFYRCELPEFMGYGCIGYGSTPEIAIQECKKSYLMLRNSYQKGGVYIENDTFKKAVDYFELILVEQVSGTNAIGGNENCIDYEPYLKKGGKK